MLYLQALKGSWVALVAPTHESSWGLISVLNTYATIMFWPLKASGKENQVFYVSLHLFRTQ